METGDLPDTHILTEEEVDSAVRAAVSGNLPIGLDETVEAGVTYQETVRHVGDTTYIVRIINDQKPKSTQPSPRKVPTTAGIQATKNTDVAVPDVGTITMRPEDGTIEKPTPANSSKETITSDTTIIQSASFIKKTPKVTDIAVKGKETPKTGSSMPAVSRTRRRIRKPEKLNDTDYVHPQHQAEKTITLPRLTKNNFSVDDLYIEIDIDRELFVSALNREYLSNGSFKYTFRISAYDFEGAFSERDKEIADETEVKKEPKSPVTKRKTPDAGRVKGRRGRPRKAQLDESTTPKSKGKIKKETVIKNVQDDKKVTEEVKVNKEDKGSEDVPETDYTESTHLEKAINDLASIISTSQEIDKIGKTEEEEVEEGVKNDEMKGEHQESKAGNNFLADPTDVADMNEQEEPIRVKKKKKEKSEDDAPERKKRKYTKRNAYSQDATNYTVKKLENGLGTRLFVCNTCGKEFKRVCDYREHALSHSEDRPFSCDVCKKLFKTRKVYRKHLIRHTDAKGYMCAECGAQFFASSELKQHMSSHLNYCIFKCNTCSKEFKHNTTLIRHKQSHSEYKRFATICHVCGANFSRKYSLTKHMHNVHRDSKATTNHENVVDKSPVKIHLKFRKKCGKKPKPNVTDEMVETLKEIDSLTAIGGLARSTGLNSEEIDSIPGYHVLLPDSGTKMFIAVKDPVGEENLCERDGSRNADVASFTNSSGKLTNVSLKDITRIKIAKESKSFHQMLPVVSMSEDLNETVSTEYHSLSLNRQPVMRNTENQTALSPQYREESDINESEIASKFIETNVSDAGNSCAQPVYW